MDRPSRSSGGDQAPAPAPALARRADGFVFGPSAPKTGAAATYWESIDAERRAMSHRVGRRQRLLAAISLRSLRRADWRSRGGSD